MDAIQKAINDIRICVENTTAKVEVFTGTSTKVLIETLNDLSYVKDENGFWFTVKCEGKTVSTFRLDQMQGCCGICVSFHAQVYGDFRRKGINSVLNILRMSVARNLGYSIMMCTDVASNVAEKKTLLKNGWQDVFRFRNKRTNNLVDISVVQL